MGYRHSKEEMLGGAVAAVFEEGLSRLTFGVLARRLGISDRIVVYCLPSKDDLIGEVLAVIGTRLEQALVAAVKRPVADHVQLVRSVWPHLVVKLRADCSDIAMVFWRQAGTSSAFDVAEVALGALLPCDLVFGPECRPADSEKECAAWDQRPSRRRVTMCSQRVEVLRAQVGGSVSAGSPPRQSPQ